MKTGRTRATAALAVAGVLGVVVAAVPAGAAGGRTPPGHLDPSFGTNGKVVLSLGAESGFEAIVALSSGKLVATGWHGNDILVMRFTATGHRDTTFGGGDGMVTTAFPSKGASGGGLAVTTGGKLLVGGGVVSLANPDASDVALVRYRPSGALDTSFGGGDGKVVTDVSGGPDIFEGFALGGDGKPVVLVESGGQPFTPQVVRFTAGGHRDHTFSGDGKAPLPTTGNPFLEAVAVQGNGKVVAAGEAAPSSDEDFALYRLTAAGAPDSTFGNGGRVFTDFANEADVADALAIDSKGRIVAAGAADVAGDQGFGVARYTKAGKLDTAFSHDGKVATNVGPDFDRIFALAISSGGKVVVAGHSEAGGGDDRWALARYGGGGALDSGFGTGGTSVTNFTTSTTFDEEADGVAIEPGGRIVGAGFTGTHPALAGYVG